MLLCDAKGKWSQVNIDLTGCEYTSNLTRFLENLTRTKLDQVQLNSNITLDKLITWLVKSDSFNLDHPLQISKYDILFIQRFLIADLNSNRSARIDSLPWRRQFVWLNDLLSRLSPIEMKNAHQLDPTTFNLYFSQCLIPVLTRDFNYSSDLIIQNKFQLVSSYVSASILSEGPQTKATTCLLSNYKLTQQNYLNCNLTREDSKSELAQSKISFGQQPDQKLMLMMFEDADLFGIPISGENNFTDLTRSNPMIEFSDFNVYDNQICSQVAGFILPNTTLDMNKTESDIPVSVTLEIKMPDNYYTLLSQIEAKLIRKQHELNQAIIDKTANLTLLTIEDTNLVYRLEKLTRLVQKKTNPFDRIFARVTENEESEQNRLLLAKPLNYSNEVAMEKLEFELNEFELNDSMKVQELRDNLINRWYLMESYAVAYARLSFSKKYKLFLLDLKVNKKNINLFVASDHQSVDWQADKPTNTLTCSPDKLIQTFKWRVPTTLNETLGYFESNNSVQTNNYRLFVNLNCFFTSTNLNTTDSSDLQFISLKHRQHKFTTAATSANNHSFKQIIQMIDQYADLFNLEIRDNNHISIYRHLESLMTHSYETFTNKIVYFSSGIACFLLTLSVIFYSVLAERLQMPRSFYHLFINIWLSSLFLIFWFVLGIRQVRIAELCLVSAIVVHYLTLCVSVWYTLYFYALFVKLYTLKDRNFQLLSNDVANSNLKKVTKPDYKSIKENKKNPDYDEDEDEEDEDEEVIRKPVLHYYLLGWGLPLLFCLVIISIVKGNYLTVPYAVCFTNNSQILIGSLLIPVCVLFLVKAVFICLILVTLRRIVNDLKNDVSDELVTKLESNDNLSDKLKLCQNWADQRTITTNISSPSNANNNLNIEENKSGSNPGVASGSVEGSGSGSPIDSNNNYSAQTSVMDSQYSPNVQLKFAFLSYSLMVIIWITSKN